MTMAGVNAQVQPFRHYFRCLDIDHGLSQMDVKALLQDSRGFIWFGTRNKLNRYDGYEIRAFDCVDPEKGMRDNNINSLFEDADARLWVGTDNGVFIFNPANEKFNYISTKANDGVVMADWVSHICNDNVGNIWIVLPNSGLFRMDAQNKLWHYTFGDITQPDHGSPQSICVDTNGNVWIGTNGMGVYLYRENDNTFSQYLGDNGNSSLEGENIYSLCDYGAELIVGVHEGKLRRFNKRRNTVSDFNTPSIHYSIIRDIKLIDNEIWVATQSGIFIINEAEGIVERIHTDPMCRYSLSDNQVSRIYQDKENGVWVGTNMGGVNYLPHHALQFIRHVPMSSANSISSKRIREIREDDKGHIWVGTEDGGINVYYPEDGHFRRASNCDGYNKEKDRTLAMLNSGGKIWVGYFKNGLDLIDVNTGSSQHFTDRQLALSESSIYALCKDRNGNVWIGNGWGVYRCNPATMETKHFPQFGMNFIFDMRETSDGCLWVATMGNGVFRYDPSTGKVVHFQHKENNPNSLSSNSVSGIYETSKGDIWFSTDRGGICHFNPDKNNFTTVSLEQGLPDDTAYSMIEDQNGKLWFGTNNGLVAYDPVNHKIETFTTLDGLPSNQFNYKAAFVSSSGDFYFGTSDGLISFNPYHRIQNSYVPPVVITKITLDGKDHFLWTDKNGEERSVSNLPALEVDNKNSSIKVQFAALSFTEPLSNQYAYKMDKVDDDWIYTNSTQSVSYANLSPGTYTFMVKGSNNDGVWQEEPTTLKIKVMPPWYASIWAWIIYLIIFGAIIYFLLTYTKKRERNKGKVRQEQYEIDKEKELYRFKLDFFTQIAHEIRTPLTLINGPLESMLENEPLDKETKDNLLIMRRNTNELMTLINQLLDFKKIEHNKMNLSMAPLDLQSILTDQFQRFTNMASSEGRQLDLTLSSVRGYVMADKNAMEKIFSNLFSNAIRYSSYNIHVSVSVADERLIINFVNDGKLIPTDQAELIFEPFSQMKFNENIHASSGIGLSLVRTLVEMQDGTIVYSNKDDLNRFTLTFPILKGIEQPQILPDPSDPEETPAEKEDKGSGATLLVVEDNSEMCNFIAQKLSPHFNVKKASNGVEAWEVMNETPVDLIISDIMMPEMNGLEFCQKVKTNVEFSHIPIILLSAKDDVKTKITGLKLGADAYIEKPFSFNHLMAQVTSILENRVREKQSFSRDPHIYVPQSGINKADEEFREKLTNIINENLTDPNFGVERLTELICMSRSSLHRKIKAISGISPTEFIRLTRLKKAVELISEGRYRIGEVCYLIGINSPSYFIKHFQKQFGMTPKEFEQQYHRNKPAK